METATLATSDTSVSFETLQLAPFLKKTISTIGYTTPTPIQAQAIPLLLEGSDLIGLAQTGTGKTAAFVLPLLHKLSVSQSARGTKALILAPTRELAEQIHDVIKTFAPRTGIKSTTVYGGVSHHNQIRALRGNPEIVVACPGRLLDHIRGRTIDLSTIEFFILDEADRMLDMGFLPDIKKIIEQIPVERQTMLFSATMPGEIESLSRQVLQEPVVIRVKSETPVALVTHSMYSVKDTEKQGALTSWLSSNPEALVVVFTKMKHTAKRLAERLEKAGVAATSLHGNLSQAKRQYALNGFRDGKYRIMIATDIAARGIDVDGVTHVVNYDMPETLDAYIHRSGRAGRAQRTGDAVSFVTRADGWILKQVEKWLGKPLAKLQGLSNADATGLTANANAEQAEEAYDEEQPRQARGRGSRRGGFGRERSSDAGGRRSRDGRGNRDRRGARGSQGGERRFSRDRIMNSDKPSSADRGDREPLTLVDEVGEPQTAFMDRKSYQTGGARDGEFQGQRRSDRSDRRHSPRSDRRGSSFGGGAGGSRGRFNRDERRGRSFDDRRPRHGRTSEEGERKWYGEGGEGRRERLPWGREGERPARRGSSFRGQQDIADTTGRLSRAERGSEGGERRSRDGRNGGRGGERRFNGNAERTEGRPSRGRGFKGPRGGGERRGPRNRSEGGRGRDRNRSGRDFQG